MASVSIPSAILSPPLPTDVMTQPGYIAPVVQPYVEQSVLVPMGNVGGQVQVPQPTVSLTQQASSASSQQAVVEVTMLNITIHLESSNYTTVNVCGELIPSMLVFRWKLMFQITFFLQQNVMPMWGPCCHWLFCWEVSVPLTGKKPVNTSLLASTVEYFAISVKNPQLIAFEILSFCPFPAALMLLGRISIVFVFCIGLPSAHSVSKTVAAWRIVATCISRKDG